MRFAKYILQLIRTRVPRVFAILRFCYQIPFILLSLPKKNIFVECKCVTDFQSEHLFGYYDKSPWNISGRYLLCIQIPFADHHPSVCDKAKILLIDLENHQKRVLGKTGAWNLQQGCRLQWLGPNFKNKIIYNDFRDDRFISVTLNIDSLKEKIIDRPIDDISSNGNIALAVDFERIHLFRPGYGYYKGDKGCHSEEEKPFPEGNGIWKIDMHTGVCALILSVGYFAKKIIKCSQNTKAARFKHIMINPSGNRFMFLFRWRDRGKEYTHLYTADMDGSNLFCLFCDGMVSHATWKNDEEIFVWARKYNLGDHFYLVRDKSNYISMIGADILTSDGHPLYSPSKRYILLDTYANKARQRTLYLFDTVKETVQTLGKFYTPFRYSGETRCDLHPRWKPDGRQICIDSAHEGKRQVYLLDSPKGVS